MITTPKLTNGYWTMDGRKYEQLREAERIFFIAFFSAKSNEALSFKENCQSL